MISLPFCWWIIDNRYLYNDGGGIAGESHIGKCCQFITSGLCFYSNNAAQPSEANSAYIKKNKIPSLPCLKKTEEFMNEQIIDTIDAIFSPFLFIMPNLNFFSSRACWLALFRFFSYHEIQLLEKIFILFLALGNPKFHSLRGMRSWFGIFVNF